ncbi:MAG: PPOX class F420-dependent oxidoreductase [bacterium]
MPATSAIEQLASESYISLATFRRSGVAVETPVWFAHLDGKFYVVTDGTSAKVKRLRNSPHVRVAACDVRGRVSGDWHEGHGTIVKDAVLVARAHTALHEKYGWQMWLLDTGSRLFGRFARRAYLEVALA